MSACYQRNEEHAVQQESSRGHDGRIIDCGDPRNDGRAFGPGYAAGLCDADDVRLAIGAALPPGYVRHLAATPIGGKVRALARVVDVEAKSVMFQVEAWNERTRIGDGTHRRGIVLLQEFERRFGVGRGAA
ncbi:hypothetical protein ACVIGB_004686 [Bradyrhizobium sp. USDA 4341]